jgi:hypothetical protein
MENVLDLFAACAYELAPGSGNGEDLTQVGRGDNRGDALDFEVARSDHEFPVPFAQRRVNEKSVLL